MLLELLFFCMVTPWILADQNGYENKSVETTIYKDITRNKFAPELLLQNLTEGVLLNEVKNVTNQNYTENATLLSSLRTSDQITIPAEQNEPCDNAEFLAKILTSILPLLKNDIPEKTRTSSVLEILKDVLKTSPEAAQDNEVMYKINDLLQTLEKYHVKSLDDKAALRTSLNDLSSPHDVKSKIVFKYEVPHFQNPNCTQELLTIIKVVQQAIMRLVNNPICKLKVNINKLPILTNLDGYFDNPDLYTYFPSSNPSIFNQNDIPDNMYVDYGPTNFDFENNPSIIPDQKEGHQILEIGFPEKHHEYDQNFPFPVFDKNTNYPYDDLPSTSKYPSHPYKPNKNKPKPPIIYPDPQQIKIPPDYSNPYDSSPSLLPMINGNAGRPVYPFDYTEAENNDYFPFDDGVPKPFNEHLVDLENEYPDVIPNPYQQQNNIAYQYPSKLLPSDQNPLYFYGSGGSSLVQIGKDRPNYYPSDYLLPGNWPSDVSGQKDVDFPFIDKNEPVLPSKQEFPPFDVTGDSSDEIQIVPKRPNVEKDNYYSEQEPSSNPNSQFDLPESGFNDLIQSDEYQSSPVQDFKTKSHTDSPFIIDTYLPSSSPSSFDVSGEGSGEIQINENKPSKDLKPYPIKPVDPSSPIFPIFDISGGGSGEVLIESNRPNPILDSDSSSLKITSSPGSAYIPFNHPSNPYDIYYINPDKRPYVPNNHDSSPDSLPTISGKPDFYPNNRPNIPGPIDTNAPDYPLEFLLPPEKPQLPFEITSDGSEKIPIATEKPFVYPHDIYFPKNWKDIPNHPEDYYLPSNENPFVINRPNDFLPESLPYKDDEYYGSPSEDITISEPLTPHPSKLEIENHYVIPNQDTQLEKLIDSQEIIPQYPEKMKPDFWDKENPIYDLHQQDSTLVPDKNIILIIKNNIGVVEHKIPKLSPEIRQEIKVINELINHQQITINEYFKIIKHYEILIELIKHLNISNEILKDLLLSMTNGGKLELQPGKSHLIELTYLIKRPKPVIYQPYYYIKYRLPYESFLTRLRRILASNPNFTNNPAKLYKELIAISKVTETSPDLENIEKEDILKITFNNGTLVDAKVIKGNDLDIYSTLDALKETNSDFTIEDIYTLIKSLDAQLKRTPNDGLVIEDGTPNFKVNNNLDGIFLKIKERPVIHKKVTQITTKKVTTNQIIKNIINHAHSLRSNDTLDPFGNYTRPDYEEFYFDPDTTGGSAAERSRPEINSKPPKVKDNVNPNSYLEPQSIDNDEKLDVAYDYIPVYSDSSKEVFYNAFPSETNVVKPKDLSYSETNIDWNQNNNVNPTHQIKAPAIKSKLIDATLKAYQKENNLKQKNVVPLLHKSIADYFNKHFKFNWTYPKEKLNHSPITSKLLDATIKAQLDQENKPKLNPDYLQQFQTYVNGVPIQQTIPLSSDNQFQMGNPIFGNRNNLLKQLQGYRVSYPRKFTNINVFNPYVHKNSWLNTYKPLAQMNIPIVYRHKIPYLGYSV